MRIKGIKIRLSFLFALMAAFLIGSGAGESFMITVVSALLHEAGHLLCLISYDAPPSEIIIGAAGFKMKMSGKILSYRQETVVSLAGVFVNFLIASLLSIFYCFAGGDNRLLMPIYANLGLGVVNLLPIEPLDGGRALYFWLCQKRTEAHAGRITDKVGLAFLMPLFILSFIILVKSGYNITLLCISIYLGISLIARAGAKR
ncbi:MAG TPA: site-2 protease family protein [Clostridiales bacterium]|jgi:stage IV sporulation protein FB|nr:site-2 protease family protein [Clostridiales bacterium]HQD72693.1 site-2 protease family protein [Clostridiales bacterium]